MLSVTEPMSSMSTVPVSSGQRREGLTLARSVEDPRPDEHEQPGLLGDADEAAQRDFSEVGMPPAKQGLRWDPTPVAGSDDGLKDHAQLVPVDPVAEGRSDLQASLRSASHGRSEQLGPAAAPVGVGRRSRPPPRPQPIHPLHAHGSRRHPLCRGRLPPPRAPPRPRGLPRRAGPAVGGTEPGTSGRAANGRSTIIRRADGRWHGWVSMGASPSGRPDRRRHVSGKTQPIVAAKVKQLERAGDKGAVPATGRTTVSSYLAEWIARRKRMGSVRPLTLSGYRTDERHIVAAIRGVWLDRLRPEHVEHLWGQLLDHGLALRRTALPPNPQRRAQRRGPARGPRPQPGAVGRDARPGRIGDRSLHRGADGEAVVDGAGHGGRGPPESRWRSALARARCSARAGTTWICPETRAGRARSASAGNWQRLSDSTAVPTRRRASTRLRDPRTDVERRPVHPHASSDPHRRAASPPSSADRRAARQRDLGGRAAWLLGPRQRAGWTARSRSVLAVVVARPPPPLG